MYQSGLNKAILNEDDFGIYLNIGNLLHWIIMTEEWHKDHNNVRDSYNRNKRNHNIIDLMKAIRFANNSMKHNMIFKKLHLMPTGVSCGSDEAICGTFYCGTDEVFWNSITGFNSNKPWEIDQYRCYNEHLKLKNVLNTLEPVVKFLKIETDNYLTENSK